MEVDMGEKEKRDTGAYGLGDLPGIDEPTEGKKERQPHIIYTRQYKTRQARPHTEYNPVQNTNRTWLTTAGSTRA